MLNFEYKTKAKTTSESFEKDLDTFKEVINSSEVGFFNLTDKTQFLDESKNLFSKFKHKKCFILIGIGGSSLGPITLVKALRKNYDTKFFYFDNIDSDFNYDLLQKVDPKDTLVYVVSKSGGTAETMANTCLIMNWLNEKGISEDQYKDYFVFSTDPVKSDLLVLAEKYNIDCLSIPSNIGGRFSILTSVGIFPALFAGIDIDKLYQGANNLKSKVLSSNIEDNDLFKSAYAVLDLYKNNISQTVLMPYSSKLKDLSDWFVQLWSESLGKNESTGLTPIPAFGATDQHSQIQLFMEGPNNKLLILMDIKNRKHDFKLKNTLGIESGNKLNKYTLNQLMDAEFQGTLKALEENMRNVIRIQIEELNEESFGEVIIFFECLTALMGSFLKINAFNQPGVEKGKIFAFEYLNSH